MIDRKKGPKITTDFDLSVNSVINNRLSNGLELYEINDGTQDIIKIELVFRTGRIHETKVASAKAAISLLREGSTRHSAAELAYIYDFYGASVKASCNMEYASVSLVVIERHFKEVWPVWYHMLLYPAYHPQEISKYKRIQSQKLIDQLSDNDVQSYRKLTEIIFGNKHPYGYNTEPTDIDTLEREDILDFYNKNIALDQSIMILSGKYTDETRAFIMDAVGTLARKAQHPKPDFYTLPLLPSKEYIKTDNEIQTSIKLGRTLFPIDHPHYSKMRLLNTILGGYFGSRLMKNIREEKGYTYGIYSSVHAWRDGGFIYISADVDNSYIEPTLEQIKVEMDILKTTEIGEEELTMVKNYLLGQTLHLLDGPFAKGHLTKSLQVVGKSFTTFEQNIINLKKTTPSELKAIAQLYLNYKDYTVVLSGSTSPDKTI